jgi:hypothetical protein
MPAMHEACQRGKMPRQQLWQCLPKIRRLLLENVDKFLLIAEELRLKKLSRRQAFKTIRRKCGWWKMFPIVTDNRASAALDSRRKHMPVLWVISHLWQEDIESLNQSLRKNFAHRASAAISLRRRHSELAECADELIENL